MSEMDKYYQILGVEPGASKEELMQAFKDLVNVWHPDRFGNNFRLQQKANEKLKEINFAYKKLMEYITSPSYETYKSNSSDYEESEQHPCQPPPKKEASQPSTRENASYKSSQPSSEKSTRQTSDRIEKLQAISLCAVTFLMAFILGTVVTNLIPNAKAPSSPATNASSSRHSEQLPSITTKKGKEPVKQFANHVKQLDIRPVTEEELLTILKQPLPQSGSVHRFTRAERVAPFEIKAAQGSHHFLKLVKADTGAPILTVFVRSGTTVNVDVPLGTYEIRFACGETWCGEKDLFGPKTVCSKADKTFRFDLVGNQVRGHSITLYKVPHGNLHTSTIPLTEF